MPQYFQDDLLAQHLRALFGAIDESTMALLRRHLEWVEVPAGATLMAQGDDGDSMHWCCTEGPEAYVGEQVVVDSLADELIAVTGDEVYVELRRRLR